MEQHCVELGWIVRLNSVYGYIEVVPLAKNGRIDLVVQLPNTLQSAVNGGSK
jgi:hypothetical protein